MDNPSPVFGVVHVHYESRGCGREGGVGLDILGLLPIFFRAGARHSGLSCGYEGRGRRVTCVIYPSITLLVTVSLPSRHFSSLLVLMLIPHPRRLMARWTRERHPPCLSDGNRIYGHRRRRRSAQDEHLVVLKAAYIQTIVGKTDPPMGMLALRSVD